MSFWGFLSKSRFHFLENSQITNKTGLNYIAEYISHVILQWRGNSNCTCSTAVICYGMIWHRGQEDGDAEGVKLAGSRDARVEGLPLEGDGDEIRNSLFFAFVAILECSGATFGQQNWAGGGPKAGLSCPMAPLVPVGMRNWVATHLWRLLVELLMVVGLHPVHYLFVSFCFVLFWFLYI